MNTFRFHPGSSTPYRGYGNASQRDPHGGRTPYYGQDADPTITYSQGYHQRPEQFQQINALQSGGADAMNWSQSFQQQQQRFAGQPPYREGGPQGFYGSNQTGGPQPGTQYPPPVPPERQLPSSGTSMQHPSQGTYGGRGASTQAYNYLAGQEGYQQYPQRSLAPLSGSNTAMNYSTSGAQQGSIPSETSPQGNYNPQAGYGQYPGQHNYR